MQANPVRESGRRPHEAPSPMQAGNRCAQLDASMPCAAPAVFIRLNPGRRPLLPAAAFTSVKTGAIGTRTTCMSGGAHA